MTYEEAIKVIESNRPTSGYTMLCEALDKAKEAFNRLAELEDKIENGTLVELPCNVGDRVYQIDGIRIYESTITKIIYDTNSCLAFDGRAIGNSVFLTREEAEKALAERSKEDE